jgi:hypothetical protein
VQNYALCEFATPTLDRFAGIRSWAAAGGRNKRVGAVTLGQRWRTPWSFCPHRQRNHFTGKTDGGRTGLYQGCQRHQESTRLRSTFQAASPTAIRRLRTPEKFLSVPEGDKQLTATVKSGKNEINFELEAGP